MEDVIDKPPTTGAPPVLPPFLQRKRRGNGRWRIIPSIVHAEIRDVTRANNCLTMHYRYMVRINTDEGIIQGPVHVNSRTYRSWLETYEYKDDIPPHIKFGGAVESGEPDPEFYNKWVKYAQETFC